MPALLALSFCGIGVYQVALAIGEQHVSAGVTSMVIASETIIVAGLATLFLGERLTGLGWLGALLGFAGVAVISLSQGGSVHVDLQVLWPLLAALGAGVYFVFQKPLLRRYTALETTTWCIWGGTIFVLPLAVRLPSQIAAAHWTATASVLYLAVCPGVVAYLAWTYALARAPASLVVNALCLVPPLAVVIAFLWLGERPTWLELCGGLVTVVGVALVGLKGMPAARGDRDRSALY
jgi:drug/metabolite transporter (DMT)-like permease